MHGTGNSFLTRIGCLGRRAPAVSLILFPMSQQVKGSCVGKTGRFVRRVGAAVFMPVRFDRSCRKKGTFQDVTRTGKYRFVDVARQKRAFSVAGWGVRL